MSILQKFLIPRHGNQSVMAGKSSLVLKRGEFFIETPNNGPGTGHCKIKIGDGVTPYPTLPYAMGDTNAEVSSSLITFDANSSAKASEALGAVVSGAQLKDMIAGFKQSISLLISAQKSFTTITDGTSSIHASSAADTLKITGGTNTTVSYDVSGKTISISSKDTTYGPASSTNAGITKLYGNTGTAVDGTMTQKAITDNINTKLDANTVDYIKSINYVDHTATVTFGNGSTTSFNTADNNTTYDVFKGTDGKASGSSGLVPTPSTADSNKYLSSNGTWGDFNSVKVANASKADVAVSDAGGNNINSTYVKNVTYSGHTVTITKGNGTTSSFNTADNNNTYSAGSGLTLTGSQFAINPNTSTVAYATTAASADKATDDSDGQAINATYIKNAAVSGRTVTFTKGNGSTFAITTQDTDTDTKYIAGSGLSLSGNAFSINQGASTVAYATTAGSATKATNDSAGNNINATYIKDVSVDGRNVTFTKGNGSTVGIVTQDTDTDTKYTAGSGLSLTGTSFSINQGASTVAYATTAASATKATSDAAGNNINATYIKDVSVSGRNVTFTKGNGSTVGIVTQDTNTDTTYKTGTTSSSGLTKLYTGTGTALDGTMTQNAITNLVNSTKSELNSAIGAINSFEIVVLDTVDDLPVTGTAHTVYFVPDDTGSGENVYDEFVWLPSTTSYEQIGVTTADLSKYYKKTDVDSKISSTKNSLVKNITYSGHTVTVTFGNGSTTSFNTADNNTTYGAGTGLSLSGNTFSINSGASTVAYAGKAGSANSAGSATTADKIATARNIKIGSSSKKFDGSSDVSYSLSEIGAQPSGYYTTASLIGASTPDCTVDDIFKLRKGTTGGVGSVNIKQKSSGLGSEVPAGWYNYIYSPHRTGIGGDNDLYATVILCPMNFSGESYILRYNNGLEGVTNLNSPNFLSANDKSKTVATVPYYTYDQLNSEFGTSGSDIETYLQNWVKKIMKSHSNLSRIVIVGTANPNAQGTIIFRAYDLGNYNNTGFPQYCEGQYFGLNSGYFAFGTYNGVWKSQSFVLSDALGAVSNTINTHIANKSNPHGVTKAQVGLGNVDNTADSAKSVKYAASAGSANAVAWGNVSGKPSTYTPSAHTHTSIESVQLTNQDLNDYKSDSVQFLYGAGGNTVANKPSGVDAFGVYTYRSAQGFYTQELVDTNGTKYLRFYKSTSWTAWKTIVDSSNVAGYKVNNAGYADSAGKATNDSAGQNINTTYIKNLAVSGRTITYTKGNGATGTITTQDTNTTYGVASQSSNGLMSAADKKAIDREFFRMLPKGGTVIPNGANLNSTAYLKVGNYYQSANVNTTNMTNIPFKAAFMMYVLSPLSEVYDNESTARWVYRLRIFIEYTGNNIFVQTVQTVSSGSTPGIFDYGPWVKMTNSNDLGAVSNTINTHIANKANPHGVTKAQVGLGNVANLDQSKAIKSITRSGTTFTATALDGTTSTFTQQDNNTTYGAGTGLTLSGTTFSINQNASTVSYAKNAKWANGASYSNYIGGAGVSTNALRDNTCFDFGYEG